MKPRESWGSRLGFLLATAGSAVGLGSLWKFPYVTGQNGGGVFVLAYLIFTFLIGLPIFMAELTLGRKAQKCPVGTFSELHPIQKNWRLIGWSCVLATFLILSFYIVVAGWALNYALMSLLNFSAGKELSAIGDTFNVLYTSGDINVLWSGLFLLLTGAIVYRGIQKGIEFWSKVLMPALFAILLLLFFYSASLEGFQQAITFVLKPRFQELTSSGLLQALGLACFTLSVGMGILITYGSYMRRHDDIPKTALSIGFINVFVSLLAALMIFPIIFTFKLPPEGGPGLLFKTLPVLFSQLPATLILSTIFFTLVVFAALTSSISVLEVLVATGMELYNWSRAKGTLIVGGAVFIISIPSALAGSGRIFPNWEAIYGKNFFDSIDYFSFTWLLPLNAIFTSLFAGWVLKKKFLKESFLEGARWRWVFTPWFFLVRWIVPFAVVFIMLDQSGIFLNIRKVLWFKGH